MAVAAPSVADERADLEEDWDIWLLTLFEGWFCNSQGEMIPFALHHRLFWEWLWNIRLGEQAKPFVAIWPRGGGKSTSAEMGVAAVAARQRRRYGLYICESQDQADDHVQNVASLLESPLLGYYYPDVGSRMLTKYGQAKGWRRNRLRTASGFTLDALGLDTAARGVKLEQQRPDFMVFDDLDGEMDSSIQAERKIKVLTRKLLPAGSGDLVVLAIQNLVHPDSIFARLADGRADFLVDRIVSGPIPALENLTYERRGTRTVILTGDPTWRGQDRKQCQRYIDKFGVTAFESECQHDVEAPPGGMFDHLEFQHCAYNEIPELIRVVVWVDPAVTHKDSSDSHGIQADGLGVDGKIYRLFSWEKRSNPEDVIRRAVLKAIELRAEAVGIETDQGGDTWASVCKVVWNDLLVKDMLPKNMRPPEFRSAKAGSGQMPKTHRASLMLADYERGGIVHVLGTHGTLEKALRRFPRTKPFDLVDASYWAWSDLRSGARNVIKLRWR